MNNPTTAELVRALRCRVMGDKCSEECICYKNFDFQCDSDYRMFDAAADRLEALEAELAALREQQRWIPVTEPPKEDGKYLVYIKFFGSSSIEAICFAHHGNDVDDYDLHDMKNVWYDFDAEYGFVPCLGVTHWMPLPEPPKEEE